MEKVDGISTISTVTCGNLLTDIADKEFKPVSIFTEQGVTASYNIPENNNLLNPFNFNAFQSVNSNLYNNLLYNPNGLDITSDLMWLAAQKPYGAASANKQEVKPAPPSKPVQEAPSSVGTFFNNAWNKIQQGANYVWDKISGLFDKLVDFAMSWIGKINNDSQGNRQFSNGKSQAWCADFVTYCVKNVLGDKLPSDFGSSAVSGIRDWGIKHNCYSTTPEPRTKEAMQQYLVSNVKPGDIMIQKRNGRSHTGIVKSVAADGSSYTVVEGNSSDRVQTVTYKATSPYLSGFVSLAQYA